MPKRLRRAVAQARGGRAAKVANGQRNNDGDAEEPEARPDGLAQAAQSSAVAETPTPTCAGWPGPRRHERAKEDAEAAPAKRQRGDAAKDEACVRHRG